MKNSYDHHDHQGIYTYNLSVPKRFTLDIPNQSPPYSKWITPQCTQLNIMLEVHLPYFSKQIVQIHKYKLNLLAIVINIQTTFALVS